VNGYSTTGIVLFFAALIWTAFIVLRARRLKTGLQDHNIKRAAIILRLRNVAAVLSLCALSVFFIIISSISLLDAGTPEYVFRDNLSNVALGAVFTLLVIAIVLTILSNRPEFNFHWLVRRRAVKKKVRAKPRFKRRPKRAGRV
jgi:hypothetical protein